MGCLPSLAEEHSRDLNGVEPVSLQVVLSSRNLKEVRLEEEEEGRLALRLLEGSKQIASLAKKGRDDV